MAEVMRFRYKPQPLVMAAAVIMFGIWAALFIGLAASDERGLSLFRIVTLSPNQADAFFYLLSFLSLGFVAIGLVSLYRGFTLQQVIEISDYGISAPKSGISRTIISVPFSQITDFECVRVNGQDIFRILHQQGLLEIPRICCTNKEAFETLISTTMERFEASSASQSRNTQ